MNGGGTLEPRAAEKAELLKRYDDQIDWYWKNSGQQKARFIRSRFAILVLGALVTLIASLAAASFVENSEFWDNVFKIATPVLAAVLAVLTGLSQTFQWGAAWREFNLSAMSLEKERDRILLTPPYRIDAVEEISKFNDLVIEETRRYFERVTGATRVAQIEERVTAETKAAVATARVNLSPAEPQTYDAEAEPYVEETVEEYPAGGDTAYEEVSEDPVYAEEEGDGGPPGGYPAEGEYEEEGDEL